MSRRVLMWVEDESLREAIRDLLHGSGYRVESAKSRHEALARIAREGRGHLHRPGVVLVDADDDGKVLATAKQHLAGIPVVVLSSEPTGERRGEFELVKPFRAGNLLSAVAAAFGAQDRASPSAEDRAPGA